MRTRAGRYSMERRWSRRAVARAGLAATAGLTGAALLGCTADDEEAPLASPRTDATPAPGDSPAPDVKRGGVAKAHFAPNDPPNLDLHQGIFYNVTFPVSPCYDQLVQFDPFELDSVIPNLASSWEFADETTLVLDLNEATFHDGAPLTSEDVAVSLERIKSPPPGVVSPRRGQLATIERIETPDERSVVMHLTRPSASIVPILATNFMAIYSARDILDDSFDHRERVNGTGPFQFERYDRGNRITLSRNPSYFEEGDLPYLDGIEFYIIPDATQAFASFSTGDMDMMNPNATFAEAIERDLPDATSHSATGGAWYATIIASYREPWGDPRSWEAVALAINKQEANEVINEGRGFVGGPLPPGSHFALPESELETVPGYSGDMEERRTEARRLLDAAGIPEGIQAQIFTRDVVSFENWGLVFQDNLAHVGVEADLYLAQPAEYDQRLLELDFGEFSAGSRSAVVYDPTPHFL